MAINIHQSQTQNLVLTPQLKQAIEILQLNAIEIDSFVEQVLEENPLLSRAEDDSEGKHNKENIVDNEEEKIIEGSEKEIDQLCLSGSIDNSSTSDVDSEFLWAGNEDFSFKDSNSSYSNDAEHYDYVQQTITHKKTLYEYLEQHVNQILPVNEQKIGYYFIEYLDEKGYLEDDIVKKVASIFKGKQNKVELVLKKLQTNIEPAGLFARDYKECIKLQLESKNLCDPMMEKFINNIELFYSGKIKKLQKKLKLSNEDLATIKEDLKGIYLDPLSNIDIYEANSLILPDVFVYKDKGVWLVKLNEQTVPNILINNGYLKELESMSHNDKTLNKFINKKLNDANFIIKALQSRTGHILQIAKAIVEKQKNFFEYGLGSVNPLGMKDIALECSIHESTVSRIVNNKYIACNFGMFEMRYFFNTAIGSTSGEVNQSTLAVKELIKGIIGEENPQRPLSDDKIVTELMSKGVNIARRTVSKYRESLSIPSSSQRKRINLVKLDK